MKNREGGLRNSCKGLPPSNLGPGLGPGKVPIFGSLTIPPDQGITLVKIKVKPTTTVMDAIANKMYFLLNKRYGTVK